VRKGEPIPPPKDSGKEMPKGKAVDKKPDGKEVHVIPPQNIAPPALEVTPITSPRVDGGLRNPF
jgi:hypothetical protein